MQEIYTQPSNEVPPYLEWFDNSLVEGRVMRVSDRAVFGLDGQRLRHNYVLDQVWNADESLIKLAGYPAAILDGETYEFKYWSNIPSIARWSMLNPFIMYGCSGNSFVSHDVRTNQRTTLRTFSEYTKVEASSKGNTSNDDKFICLEGRNSNGRTLFIYDIELDEIVSTKLFNDVRWYTVSQSGNYVVVAKNIQGTGNGTGGTAEGLYSYDLNFNNEVQVVTNGIGHGDVGYDQDDNEVYVSYATQDVLNEGYSLFMSRLDTGERTLLFPKVNNRGLWSGHLTCPRKRKGWAYVSEHYSNPNYPMANRETFALKLDESNLVERYVKHDCLKIEGSLYHSAQGVPNPTGTKILFASNKSNPSEMSKEAPPVYVLEVKQ